MDFQKFSEVKFFLPRVYLVFIRISDIQICQFNRKKLQHLKNIFHFSHLNWKICLTCQFSNSNILRTNWAKWPQVFSIFISHWYEPNILNWHNSGEVTWEIFGNLDHLTWDDPFAHYNAYTLPIFAKLNIIKFSVLFSLCNFLSINKY